jgi:hypothetical protein
MAQTVTHAAATLSWIDPRSGLPKTDVGDPGGIVTRDTILGRSGYRFANFLEASVTIDDDGNFVGPQFTQDSGLRVSMSALGQMPVGLPTKQSITTLPDAVVFKQTTGASTKTPEKIGWLIGGFIGATLAHAIEGFPPIWTEVMLRILPDGTAQVRFLRHSLFPSVSFYAEQPHGQVQNFAKARPTFDGVPTLARWQAEGWGTLKSSGPDGPVGGNPWGELNTM